MQHVSKKVLALVQSPLNWRGGLSFFSADIVFVCDEFPAEDDPAVLLVWRDWDAAGVNGAVCWVDGAAGVVRGVATLGGVVGSTVGFSSDPSGKEDLGTRINGL